ncbi:hypothetical protein [Streptomyces sp. NPDC008137]|uniref:hypothetical protein n=1 Tax=Streptomyces sp. NPDC008137 TaxID=3364813 RepID=UPI0036E0BDEA
MPASRARRRTVLTCAALLTAGGASLQGTAPAKATGRILAERRLAERLIEVTIDSPALGGSSRVALHPSWLGPARTR